MGKTVVADETFSYLISNQDDEIFVFPRKGIDPDFSHVCRSVFDRIYPNGGPVVEYLGKPPWRDGLRSGNSQQIHAEDALLKIMKDSINRSKQKYTASRHDLENSDSLWHGKNKIISTEYFNPKRHGALQILNFLEAFCWVSKLFQLECYELNDNNYDFRLYRKSGLSFLGKKGDLIFTFRWDEFIKIEITNLISFTVFTKQSNWGASMGRRGFAKG